MTLHVGAGTFQPVRARQISEHEMHCEHFSVTSDTIYDLIEYQGKIIPVGTTTVRTLESLYWLGVKITRNIKKQVELGILLINGNHMIMILIIISL